LKNIEMSHPVVIVTPSTYPKIINQIKPN